MTEMLTQMIRVINIIGCGYALWLLIQSWHANKGDWSQKTRDYWFVMAIAMVLGAEAAIENLIQNNPAGFRLGLTIVMWLLCIKAIKSGDEVVVKKRGKRRA